VTPSESWANIVKNASLDLTRPINYLDMGLIRKYGGKDVRLLTSIPSEEASPTIFRLNGVFVLPLSRRRVVLVKGKGFHHLEELSGSPETFRTEFSFPSSVLHSRGESRYIDYAYSCGLLGKFTERSNLHLGFRGRRLTSFSFMVDGHGPFQVEKAQIEVDSSFEDEQKLILVEGKSRLPSSFNIRQLYYPFRTFYHELLEKEVQCVFFVYDPENKEYCFWRYRFRDPNDYEQIELVRGKSFRIEPIRPEEPLKGYEVEPVKMGAIQANDIFKLMELPFLIADGIDDARKVAVHFRFDRRQSSYYRQGMERLGFVKEKGTKYVLTETGERYVKMPPEQRTKFFLKKLFEYPVVNEVVKMLLVGESVSNSQLNDIVAKHDPEIAKSTVPRRASTIRRWFKWIEDNTGYCRVDEDAIRPFTSKDTLNGYR
jgi:hypothetical protein